MEVNEKDILRVIKTLNSIEVKGYQNLSMLYAAIDFLTNLVYKKSATEETSSAE